MRVLDQLTEKYSKIFYIQIWQQKLKVTDASTGRIYEDIPLVAIQTKPSGKKEILAIGSEAKLVANANVVVVNPFSHPRVLFSDFTIAEKLLQFILSRLNEGKFIALKPVIVIHPMEKNEGDLTMIENRAFKELGAGIGAREVFVIEGNPVPVQDLNRPHLLAIEKLPHGHRAPANKQTSLVSLILFLAAIMLLAFIGSQDGN